MAQHKDIAIDIKDLTKKVKKKELITPITHQLQSGKILALCGGNGAGKSTLIRLITGLMSPTTGEVSINGFTKRKDKTKFTNEFGYMPDDFEFQKSITCNETIRFYAKLKKIDNTRTMEVIEEVGLSDKLSEKVGTFSKGMNQRLLLAQALLAKPELLILDEPTNGLDPYWVNEFSEMMLRAKENGQTVIFSTHDLYVAEEIADEVMFLKDGKVISKGAVVDYNDVGLYETFQQLYFEHVETN